MLAVHGVLRAENAPAVDDLAPQPLPVRPVVEGRVAAVVSEAADRELGPEDAVDHLDLLAALVAHVAVLPVALGTLAPDDDAVRAEILRPQAERFGAQLEGLRDVVELRLDLTFDLDVAAALTASDPGIAALAQASRAPGAGVAAQLALGEAVARGVAERMDALTEEWTRDLVGGAELASVLSATEESVRLAFLVRRDRIADADEAVARLRDEVDGQAEVEYVGPLPAYSFLAEVAAGPQSPAASRWGW